METIRKAFRHLEDSMQRQDKVRCVISYESFIGRLVENPALILRNVFQVFHDMIHAYVGEGQDEYPDDPESIRFVHYDCTRLFVDGTDHPFFADRLFANRLIHQVEALRRGAQQNKIYIFDGPPGCGKSTFLNNLLMKFEQYANTDEGMRYETLWRLDRRAIGGTGNGDIHPFVNRILHLMQEPPDGRMPLDFKPQTNDNEDPSGKLPPEFHLLDEPSGTLEETIEVPCPSHDHPILLLPKEFRRTFFDELFENDEFKYRLYTEKEYDWVFRETACTICQSLYEALLEKLGSPLKVFGMVFARPYRFSRRMGEGISVFNPGDKPTRQTILTNPILQSRINAILRDSNRVRYLYSQYARTNNGIYALMDIKGHNVERLIELHNIISEEVHKVEDIEENVHSLFLALMNPEDRKNIEDVQSFSDRIESVNIPYVLDLKTEVAIYRNIFGKHIDASFLPRVLHNFARVIISTRLKTRSEALMEWIENPQRYSSYCDENLMLLKMEIYAGHIPNWLTDEDRKRFTAKRRRRIIAESESEGNQGLSGRDSIKIFNEFYSFAAREGRLIHMAALSHFFTRIRPDLLRSIPAGFLESLQRLYNYTVLQEVKEALYDYNEEAISRNIQNYLFAVNFEIGAVERCRFTGDRLEITEEYLVSQENVLIGEGSAPEKRTRFRSDIQKEYAAKTLTVEMMQEGKAVTETKLYKDLYERAVYNLKEKALDPLLKSEAFRMAIKDFGTAAFSNYDARIKADVQSVIENLGRKFQYSQLGAKEVCMYVIDNDIARKFSTSG